MKKTHIIIHESDSSWGSAEEIHKWHLERGWSQIGYNLVILNGQLKSKSAYNELYDGFIEHGRMYHIAGAHARGYNKQSIGICLIGKHGSFSESQMSALINKVVELVKVYQIPVENVLGHYEIPLSGGKVCPEIEMVEFRKYINERILMGNYGA